MLLMRSYIVYRRETNSHFPENSAHSMYHHGSSQKTISRYGVSIEHFEHPGNKSQARTVAAWGNPWDAIGIVAPPDDLGKQSFGLCVVEARV